MVGGDGRSIPSALSADRMHEVSDRLFLYQIRAPSSCLFFLAIGWETANHKVRNHAVIGLTPERGNSQLDLNSKDYYNSCLCALILLHVASFSSLPLPDRVCRFSPEWDGENPLHATAHAGIAKPNLGCSSTGVRIHKPA